MRAVSFLTFLPLIVCATTPPVFGVHGELHPLPYVSAQIYLQHLDEREKTLVPLLRKYYLTLTTRLKLIEDYLEDYEQSGIGGKKRPVSAHPLASYRMIRRFATGIGQLRESLLSAVETELKQFEIGGGYKFPTLQDQRESTIPTLTMQSVYNLSAVELMEGGIWGFQTGVGLSLPQILQDVIPTAIASKMTDAAQEWLNAIKTTVDSETHEQVQSTILGARDGEKIQPDAKRDSDIYSALCSGGDFRASKTTAALFCWLDQSRNPISPERIELVHDNPRVLLFHNFLLDSWSSKLIEAATPKIKRETIQRKSSKASYPLVHAWMNEAETNVGLTSKIKQTFNLSHRDSLEDLRIGWYFNGGDYKPHLDVYKGTTPGTREGEHVERILTLLIYMNKVDRGGATIFPVLGFGVFPQAGAALFWDNYDLDGEPDARMLHAGCPVALGTKWVATRWIHIREKGYKSM